MTERDERLIELALGILDDETRVELEDELARSPEARKAHAGLEATLETLALATDPMPPSPEGRALLLRSLEPSTSLDAYVDRLAALFDLGRSRAVELLADIAGALQPPWEEGRVAGVRLLHFDGGPRQAAAHCGLVHIQPGVSYPGHRHRGDEWSLILAGRAEEDSGCVWQPGDLVHRAAGSAHAFRIVGDEPFVFAVAVQDGIEYQRD